MSGDHNQYQKPVAWTSDLEFDSDTEVIPANEKGKLGTDLFDIPLYTTPPQREWQGLTDEDWADFMKDNLPDKKDGHTRMRAVWEFSQAKLKEKNT